MDGVERLGGRAQRVLRGEPGNGWIVGELGFDPRVKFRERAKDPLIVRFRLPSQCTLWNERIAGGSSTVLSRCWAARSPLVRAWR